jgi:hypothetical protein
VSGPQDCPWVTLGFSPLPRIAQPDLWPWRQPLMHQPEVIGSPALWFRNADMVVEGSNEAPRRVERPLPGL